MKKGLSSPLAVALLALLCNLIWGSAFPAIKLGYDAFSLTSADSASIILFAGLRFGLVGVVVLGFGSIVSRKPLLPGRDGIRDVLALSSVRTVIQQILYYIGLSYTTAARSSIINGSSVFFSILVSALLFRQEKITHRKLAGCLIGFAGVVVINLGTDTAGGILHGDILTLLSTLCIALGSSMS